MVFDDANDSDGYHIASDRSLRMENRKILTFLMREMHQNQKFRETMQLKRC